MGRNPANHPLHQTISLNVCFFPHRFGVDVNILRSAADIVRKDGKKLGIKTEWAVNGAPASAKVNVKLFHAPTSVNDNAPSPTNQLGAVTGGEADVNAMIGIK